MRMPHLPMVFKVDIFWILSSLWCFISSCLVILLHFAQTCNFLPLLSLKISNWYLFNELYSFDQLPIALSDLNFLCL